MHLFLPVSKNSIDRHGKDEVYILPVDQDFYTHAETKDGIFLTLSLNFLVIKPNIITYVQDKIKQG
jgi:hypothetical protein